MRIIKCGIVLILALLLLAGCKTVPVSTTTPPTEAPTTAPTEPTFPRPDDTLDLTEKEPYEEGEMPVSCRLLPETVDNPDNLPVLKWICFCTSYSNDTYIYISYVRDRQWSEEAADEVNAMLAENGLPFRIQFMLFTTEEKYIDWLRVPEVREAMAEADLITGLFEEAAAVTYLSPITEYISEDAEVSLSGLVAHEYSWNLATYGGEVYGLPVGRAFPTVNGWHVRDEVFTEYGFTIEDFQKDFFSMDEVFAELYEKNGNEGFLHWDDNTVTSQKRNGATVIWPGSMNEAIDNRFDCIGLCYAIDYSGEKPVVVNYLETEYFARMRQKMLEYTQLGYWYRESDANQLVSYNTCYSAYPACYYEEPHGRVEAGYRWLIPAEETTVSLAFGRTMTGILKESDQKTLALQLLETLGEDESFRKQFLFGQEGKDYEVVDGRYQSLSRQDGTYNMKFLSGMSAFCGVMYDDFITEEFILPEAEGMTRLEAYQSSVNQSRIWTPVKFNWSEMGKEHDQIEQILRDYFDSLPFLSDRTCETMLTRVREAGGDRIQRELQRQLDEWLAENPEWLESYNGSKTEN